MAKPEPNLVEKMKASPIKNLRWLLAIVTSEEDRCGKDSLEGLNKAPIVAPVKRQSKEGQHLAGAGKMHNSTLLPNR
jgi:hypothetical protein